MTENNEKPKPGPDKPKPNPADMHRKASEHLRKSCEHADAAALHLEGEEFEKAQNSAFMAHAHQVEATHHLNEAIKHQSGIKKKDHPKDQQKD